MWAKYNPKRILFVSVAAENNPVVVPAKAGMTISTLRQKNKFEVYQP